MTGRKNIKREKAIDTRKIIKNITIGILDFLLGIPEALAVGFDRPTAYRAIQGNYDQELTVAKICHFFNSLKRRGYIKIQNKDGQESVVFTNKAKIALVDRIVDQAKWDGKYRLVSFDIPEPMRRNRNSFRRAIKRMGFKQVQKSLWVSNKNAGPMVELAAYEYGVEKYVIYIVAESTDIDGTIAKMLLG